MSSCFSSSLSRLIFASATESFCLTSDHTLTTLIHLHGLCSILFLGVHTSCLLVWFCSLPKKDLSLDSLPRSRRVPSLKYFLDLLYLFEKDILSDSIYFVALVQFIRIFSVINSGSYLDICIVFISNMGQLYSGLFLLHEDVDMFAKSHKFYIFFDTYYSYLCCV